MLENFPGVDSNSLYSLLVLFKPDKENSCPVFMSSTKREIRHFTSTSCNDGREMYKIV